MITMDPVLELDARNGFTLWPVADVEPYTFLRLCGGMEQAEVGTAVMQIAATNAFRPEDDDCPPLPSDPRGAFLHGLLTREDLVAAGGLRVHDAGTGVTVQPGCCDGLEEWRDWYRVFDGDGFVGFGHDPSPTAERRGDTVRLTVDVYQEDSPVIDLPGTALRHLLAGAERDLAAFLALAAAWAAHHLPAHAAPVTAALARCLDVRAPGAP
ncbi:hypothetical protein [Streptomyces rimosus]|uniref:hypothetical protein n=1 Tax=Streptomyces rimosus TaxID=1927 RepID=UPI0004C8DCFA|nr:hypothetical protein [Streptomyces rimosus]